MTGGRIPRQTELETFGVVCLIGPQLEVAHISASCGTILGVDRERFIGAPITEILDGPDASALAEALTSGIEAVGWRRVQLASGGTMKLHAFDAGAGLVGIDLTPLPAEDPGPGAQALERVAAWNTRLLAYDSSADLLSGIASLVRELTEFNGAWVSRKDHDGRSTLVASDVHNAPSAVGQTVQPSDSLPGQPELRGRPIPFFVADLAADATRLCPEPPDGVDLTGSLLLRPYPQFLARMADLGVRSLAAIPIVMEGEMWGRVLSFHPSALRVPAATQAELGLLGVAAGARLHELLATERALERDALTRSANAVVKAIAASDELIDGLVRDQAALCGVCAASAAVVSIADRVATAGPIASDAAAHLLEVARRALRRTDDAMASSTTLDGAAPVDETVATGYLAVRLDANADDIVVWAAGETHRDITWVAPQLATNEESNQLFVDQGERVEPRRGSCAPWSDAQQEQAAELREAIGEVLIARYSQVTTLNAELTRSNEEYDAFARAVAHDLKAPLRGIRQTSEFLIEDIASGAAPDPSDLHTVVRLAERMDGMLDDLLAYTQVGNASWEPRPVALQTAVAEILELLGDRVDGASISIEDAFFTGDPAAVRQVLLNLVGNAVKYGGERPTIEIDVTTVAELGDAVPDVFADASPKTQVLRVTDDGIGIDEVNHERIFDLFRQLDPGAEGSGTGLALCRLICRRHGGEIWLKSTPDEGTTFFAAVDR
ncbi:MAG: ATP-binding protein [Solirubrobacteraceae bacterium]|nr:ATP-binding protein [Solirubrobacteraceae bacterium]